MRPIEFIGLHDPIRLRSWMRSGFLLAFSLGVSSLSSVSQTGAHPPTQPVSVKQEFEAASVRIDDPHSTVNHNDPNDASNQPQTFPSNHLTMRYYQMKSLICAAYSEIDCGHVLGGPDWLNTNAMHYNITAKVEGDAMLTMDEMKPMLRNLLKERFHLTVHNEHRIVPGYAAVIAKGGPKLVPHKDAPFYGFFGASEFKFQDQSVKRVADLIGYAIRQPVVDKTGLSGSYDVDLKFAPLSGPLKDDPRFSNLPDIFTAVQEQLGLKLVRQKVPGEYLLIDHVDRMPTEN